MSEYEFTLPDVGEGVAEAEIEEWHVDVGTDVVRDQPLVSVLTDKATLDLSSPVTGTVVAIGAPAGQRLAVGSLLVRFETDPGAGRSPAGDGGAADARTSERMTDTSPAPEGADVEVPQPPAADAASRGSSPEAGADAGADAGAGVQGVRRSGPRRGERRVLTSPAVRRRALEAGVDLRLVPGSGPAERITREDLEAYLHAPPSGGHRTPDTTIDEVPVIGVRRMIAERMSLAKSRIPHITIVEEVDVTALEELRRALKERTREGRPPLTPLAFIALAVVRAVHHHPVVNARFDDERNVVERYGGVHIGVATQTDRGLVVPVVRHAETNSLWDMAAEIVRVSSAARSGHLSRGEMSGSTITITSLGALGGLITTPVINHPEVAIVGINKRQTRPVWDGATFVPRQMMNISCGFDHRVVDGWDAATFMQRVKEFLETPALLFMEGD